MSARMRPAGVIALLAFGVVAIIGVVLIALPVTALLRDAAGHAGAGDAAQAMPGMTALARSVAYAAAAALAGALLAWPASRVLRRTDRTRGDTGMALLALLPIAMPPWLLYAAAWMNCGPGTVVGDLCERADCVPILRTVLLVLSLTVWSAACAWAVLALSAPAAVTQDERLLRLDGARWTARMRSALARDARSVLVAAFGAMVFLLCETTVFDLAQVPTLGFELRTMDALGAPAADVVRAALPAMLLAVIGAVLLPVAARRAGDDRLRSRGGFHAPRQGGWGRAGWPRPAMVLLAMPALLLIAALVRVELAVPRAGDFIALHGRALVSTAVVALLAALVVGMLAAALRVLMDAGHSRGARAFARTTAVTALAFGLVPPTVTAIAFAGAYNTDSMGGILGSVYDSPWIVVMVLAARALPVAAIVPMALAAREPRSASRLRTLDGVSIVAAWRGIRAEAVHAAAAASAIAFAWSLGELTASGRVVPPGFAWLATDILNAIHYQRPETVVLATLSILVAAAVSVWVLAALVRRTRASVGAWRVMVLAVAVSMALSMAVVAPGCAREPSQDGASTPGSGSAGGSDDDRLMAALRAASPRVDQPLAVDLELEGVGRGKGQFNGPRVLAVDGGDGSCVVVDKDARLQRFDRAGAQIAEWRMPKWDRGKPVGASVAPDGSIVVADTHEHRLVCYSPTGEMRWTLGEYGTGPGQFIYPTDIVFLADGRLLVAEYGGNDRIQAFGADRRVMYQFGRSGTEPGEFLRPQAMAYDAERDELYVVDSGNHRVQVFTSDGELRRTLGRPGMAAGELSYPFGLTLLIGGRAIDALGHPVGAGVDRDAPRTVALAEHGNHRVQVLDGRTGESLAIAGGIGRERGRLKYPWAIEPAGIGAGGVQRFAVCDHGNSRIVFCTIPFASGPGSTPPAPPASTTR